MKKVLPFILCLASCALTGMRAQGADTLRITLTKGTAGFTTSPAVTTWGQPLQITVTGSSSNTDMAILQLFRDGVKVSSPQVMAVHGRFIFPELTTLEKKADSVILQFRIGGQAPVSLKLFAKVRTQVVNARSDQGDQPDQPPAGLVLAEPGNLIYDALRLSNPNVSRVEINKRINYYLGAADNAELSSGDNRYLRDYLARTANIVDVQGSARAFSFKSILSGVGGLDVTTLVDGLAKFLVARTKQELETSFFTRFKEEMARPEYKDLRILFPSTYQKLQAIGMEIYQFDLYKQALREAFASDLKNILTNMPEVIRDGRFAPWFDQHKDIRAIVLSGLYIYNSLAAGQHPGEVIAGYDLSTLDGINNQVAVTGIVQTVQQISYALKAAGPGRYWTTPDSLKMVLADTNLALPAFMGLLWIKAENVRYTNGSHETDSLRGVINFIHDSSAYIWQFKQFVTSIVQEARTVEASLASLKQKKNVQGASLVYEDYYAFVDQCLHLLQHLSTGLQALPYIRNIYTVGVPVDFYVRRAKEINEIGLDVATANYHSAIVTLSSLYDSLTFRVFGDTASKKTNEDKRGTVRSIIKYGILMAGVVTSKNSDEVQQAIESVALPSGSSRIKRESIFNIALNAFVGLHGGHENIKSADNGSSLNAFGVTAPVGVAFSWGSRPVQQPNGKITGGKSNGVFLSLLDIGAVTTLRFGDTTTSRLPTIQLQNIVAPGIFYSHGFGKCPLSLNIGVQYGPRLRDLKSSQATVLDNGYWRVGVSLLMDIPLLNFYNKN